MDASDADRRSRDCSSKILKNTEDYVSKKLKYVYKQTSTDFLGLRIPSYVLRTSLFLSVVFFTFATRFYLIHEPKHIW